MSYDSDYRSQTHGQKRLGGADRPYHMDMSPSGGSAKGLAIAAVCILAFIAFLALLPGGDGAEVIAPVGDGTATETLPSLEPSGTVAPTPAPATGE